MRACVPTRALCTFLQYIVARRPSAPRRLFPLRDDVFFPLTRRAPGGRGDPRPASWQVEPSPSGGRRVASFCRIAACPAALPLYRSRHLLITAAINALTAFHVRAHVLPRRSPRRRRCPAGPAAGGASRWAPVGTHHAAGHRTTGCSRAALFLFCVASTPAAAAAALNEKMIGFSPAARGPPCQPPAAATFRTSGSRQETELAVS